MGRGFVFNNSRFGNIFMNFDKRFRQISGIGIAKAIFCDDMSRNKPFLHLSHTHPAVFGMQYCAARYFIDKGIVPDSCIGISLGEIVANTVSGSLRLDDSMYLVHQQVVLLQNEVCKGGMSVVFGNFDIVAGSDLFLRACSVVAKNYRGSMIVAYRDCDKQSLLELFDRHRLINYELPVEYPFHSEFMDAIKSKYLEICSSIEFQIPSCDTVSTIANGRPI
jgi:bacillaene synthase trans-acting acyltransferase